jgi:hypothetical protein
MMRLRNTAMKGHKFSSALSKCSSKADNALLCFIILGILLSLYRLGVGQNCPSTYPFS